MLTGFTFIVMIVVAYAAVREGLLTAITTLVNICLAGVFAFNFYEPLAEALDGMLSTTFVGKFVDSICLIVLFAIALGILRVLTNNLANTNLELSPILQQVASGLIALVSGYLLAGILVVIFQTLPWDKNFLGFDGQAESGGPRIRMLLPPDRVWLGMLHRAGLGPFSQNDAVTFDAEGTFTLRHARLRRFEETP